MILFPFIKVIFSGTLGVKMLPWVACLWSKMPKYVPEGRKKEGGLSLPPAFQHLILMAQRACDLNLGMIFSLVLKWRARFSAVL